MAEQFENWFQVDRHANGGFIVLRMINDQSKPFDLAPIEIPEANIPHDLRSVGSRFRMTWGNLNADTVDEIRQNQTTVYQVTERWTERDQEQT